MCRYLFKILISIPLHIYPEIRLLVHVVVLFLIKGETLILFSIVSVPIYIHTYSPYPDFCQQFVVYHLLLLLSHSAAHKASLSFTISQSSLKLMSMESMMPSNHLILCCLFLLLPTIFPSIRVFSNESALCIRWPKYWSFSSSPSSEYSGLISFRID